MNRFMARANELSRGGFPAPNPHVGCVIVQGDEIVGEGYHDHAGGPHAEVVALQQAGDRARGATVYCTLEPCRHQGRTPPCAEALIEAGVKAVFVAVADPNPIAGGGAELLRQAGIGVEFGLGADEAEEINRIFLTAMRRKMPYVVIKMATTIDDRTALSMNEQTSISGPESQLVVHRLRAQLGAVLVGRRTAEIDNPRLTARIEGVVNQPIPIVIDPDRLLPNDLHIFQNPNFVRVTQLDPQSGNELSVTPGDLFDLKELLEKLFERGIRGLLVEGGGITATRFLEQGHVDEIHRIIVPKLFGQGPGWIAEVHEFDQKRLNFRLASISQVGDDAHLVWRRVTAEV